MLHCQGCLHQIKGRETLPCMQIRIMEVLMARQPCRSCQLHLPQSAGPPLPRCQGLLQYAVARERDTAMPADPHCGGANGAPAVPAARHVY